MDSTIWVAIITGICSLIGTILTVRFGQKKAENKQDVLLYRIDQLEKKQDKHNSIIERTYKIESHLAVIDEDIKLLNKRIDINKK